MSNNKVNSFIKMVIEEDLVKAQSTLKEYLNEKLTSILQEKYEDYAPTIFEKWDAEKADKNDDGEVSDWEKASTKWASKGENNGMESDEEQSSEEEEEDTENENGEEDSEEDEEEEDEEEED